MTDREYSGRTFEEVCKASQEEFYKYNGYYPTPEMRGDIIIFPD